jgi:hypothetical protein
MDEDPTTDTLDAAWAAAEAALPESGIFSINRYLNDDGKPWYWTEAPLEDENWGVEVRGEGPTPTAALRALTARLTGGGE